MPTEYVDLGEWALAKLKATTAVTDLVQAGADGILESGTVANELVDEWQKARRDTGTINKVLVIYVQDVGDNPDVPGRRFSCVVWIYDRGLAYSNIRTAREAVIEALVGEPVLMVRDVVVVSVDYGGRTGHAIDRDFDLDVERVRLFGPIVAIEPDEYA